MRYLLTILIICSSIFTYAQFNNNSINTSGYYSGSIISINELPLKKSTTLGSTYLSDEWMTGNIYVNKKEVLKNQQFKYDIRQQLFEILTTNDRIVILPANRVLRFVEINSGREFVNSSSLAKVMIKESFMEILNKGKIMLLRNYYLTVKEPTYNLALDVGEKDRRIELNDKLYLFYKSEIKPIEGNKKKVAKLFENEYDEALIYIKENNVSSNNEEELLMLVEFMNKDSTNSNFVN